jgi:dedicator of cytokinesis protein 3
MFDYTKLSALHKRLAEFYTNIIAPRPEPQYFRVGYFGTSLPAEFRNKEFVYVIGVKKKKRFLKKLLFTNTSFCCSYRGWKNDHITVFTERIQSQFPTAQLLMKSTPPTAEMKSSPDISIMISKVNPLADPSPHRFKGRAVPGPMAEYYERHHVSRFFYVRPFNKGPKTGNEFETLWTERNDLLCESALPRMVLY